MHHLLEELLPPDQYFRFNPNTTCDGIDEIRPDKLGEMVGDAHHYIAENQESFDRLAEILRPRGLMNYWNQFLFFAGAEIRYVRDLFRAQTGSKTLEDGEDEQRNEMKTEKQEMDGKQKNWSTAEPVNGTNVRKGKPLSNAVEAPYVS